MLPAQAKREMWPCNAAARAEDEEDEARMACTWLAYVFRYGGIITIIN